MLYNRGSNYRVDGKYMALLEEPLEKALVDAAQPRRNVFPASCTLRRSCANSARKEKEQVPRSSNENLYGECVRISNILVVSVWCALETDPSEC